MRTRLIWENCSINNNVSSFWVECKDEEVITKILPSINVPDNQFFEKIRNNRGPITLSSDKSDIDFCNFFLISIDCQHIKSFAWVMPYSGMWNASNPFEEFSVIDFNELNQLQDIYKNLNITKIKPKNKIMTKKNELNFIDNGSINFEEYNKLFDRIKSSETKEQLVEISKDYNLDLVSEKFPRLEFTISLSEINELKGTGLFSINENDEILSINQNELNPIAKLFYSLIWKQGDLQKLKLIIKGVEEVENPKLDNIERLVFYCFGNHLANPKKYPIIDQHVIRAYNLYCANSNSDFIRKSNKVNIDDREKYLMWFKEIKKDDSDFLYLLDRLLFEIGKAVKIKKK